MSERLFLYIDILGFKDLVTSGYDVGKIYKHIDHLNVHRDKDFKCIVFSDTILVYGAEFWLGHPREGLMWLIEFAQDLFYRLIAIDIHIRAYITRGEFEHHVLQNVEAYYGSALIDCYEREKQIKCTGVFLDSSLAPLSDIFHVTKYDEQSHYVHVMQHLDMIRAPYEAYPISGESLLATGMESWVAYLLRYLQNTFAHAHDESLPEPVRTKYRNAWTMISDRHPGLTRRLEEAAFEFGKVVEMDWAKPIALIGTERGAWG
jgi:hypothetical protein